MYVGRFAPSPTGPLHFGSLATALAGFLDARRHGGRWLLRIEDIDPPREQPGAADHILRTLDALGLHWDGEVCFQRLRRDAHEAALARLASAGLVYPCSCSRSEIASRCRALGMTGPPRYPGTCRERGPRPGRATCVRLRVEETDEVAFHDRLQGPHRCHPASEFGDFVLRRRDGLTAYQLAVVVDDHEQHVTHVVRGTDLLAETPKQILLQGRLGHATPAYAHVPVATHASGQKLSKQSGAPAVDAAAGGAALFAALRFLRQSPPPQLARARPAAVLDWAREHWRPEHLAGVDAISLE